MVRFVAQFVLALLILAAFSTLHASGLEDGLSAICNGNYFRIQDCGASSARNCVTAQRIKLSETADNRPSGYQQSNSNAGKGFVADCIIIASL